ncbi:hypothetical protein DL771_004082 [Monosporascus sp. 5C6A]|nr:hypothetical protein DL771_004082 [Monosporascus sp. 5C6A]
MDTSDGFHGSPTFDKKDDAPGVSSKEDIAHPMCPLEVTGTLANDTTWEKRRHKIPKVVDVKWVDFDHFKNRYSPHEGLEIIEVLRGHDHIRQEVKERLRPGTQKRWASRSLESLDDAELTWIQRVRIQSPPILLLLSRLTGHRDNWAINRPRVFFRPFRTFYYYLPQMKECLSILEEKWAKVDVQTGGEQAVAAESEAKLTIDANQDETEQEVYSDSDDEGAGGDDTELIRHHPDAAVAGPIADSVTALRHVRKYVEFVEAKILPLWKRAAGTTHRKVRFLDLWMSFQPGELLCVPPPSDSQQSLEIVNPHGAKSYQMAWMLYSMELIPHKFIIQDYEGKRDITTLQVYPMRFYKNEKKKAELHSLGILFQNVVRQKHLYYNGWTVTHGPSVEPDLMHRNSSEYIDGDVIIDFVEGCRANPSLSPPSFGCLPTFDDGDWPNGCDRHFIKHWSNGSRSQLLAEIKETTQLNEYFANYLRSRHSKESKFLQDCDTGNVTQLEGQEHILLPRRVIAYALRERKFVMLNIQNLREVSAPQNVFGDLKIDEDHKRMVKSLVKSHFQKQNRQAQQQSSALNQDLIQGKGSGLVILLHGVPGVGKTATAEAVALANKKPLFAITCGDLGFTPNALESSLRNIFRLAHLWGCVLLLDEADIFLSRRELSDLKRNALVSVFLRVLEYYSGVLFLTTNRVGTLDEAFKSRIHLSLYYQPLSKDQTLGIFEVNLRKLHTIEDDKQRLQADGEPTAPKQPVLEIDDFSIMHYAKWHYEYHEPHERWNGRQIRNAFQLAYSLAYFDVRRTSLDHWDENDAEANAKNANGTAGTVAKSTLKLDYQQFEMVASSIEKFDKYLFDANAGSYMDNARIGGIRADDHDPNRRDGGSVYRPPSLRTQPPRTRRQSYTPTPRGQGPPQRPYYQPPRQDYQPPQHGSEPQPLPNQRPRLQGTPRMDNSRLPQRNLPSQVTQQSKPPLRRREDSGYWSTAPRVQGLAAGLEGDYFPEEGEAVDGEYEDLMDNPDSAYNEYNEGYLADGRF